MPESIFYSKYSGLVGRTAGSGETFNTLRGGAGTTVSAGASTKPRPEILCHTDTDKWTTIVRGGYVWDTSDLPNTCTIDSATVQAVADAVADQFGAVWKIHACSFAPTDSGSWVTGDYGEFGNTSWGDHLADDSLPQTLEISLSTLTFISKTGDSILGLRDAGDLSNNPPSWGASDQRYLRLLTGNPDAKLRVVYTPSAQTATPSIVTAEAGILVPTLRAENKLLPTAIALSSVVLGPGFPIMRPATIALEAVIIEPLVRLFNSVSPGAASGSAAVFEPLLIGHLGPRKPGTVKATAGIFEPLLRWWSTKDAVTAQAGVFAPLGIYSPWIMHPQPVAAVAEVPLITIDGINVPPIAAPAYNLPTVLYLTSEDNGLAQTFYVRQRGDRPIDITEATSVVFKAYDIDGNIVLSKPGTVEDALNGIVNFSFLWTDFPGEGLYLLKLVLQFGGPTAERSFPSHDSFCYLILNDSFHG